MWQGNNSPHLILTHFGFFSMFDSNRNSRSFSAFQCVAINCEVQIRPWIFQTSAPDKSKSRSKLSNTVLLPHDMAQNIGYHYTQGTIQTSCFHCLWMRKLVSNVASYSL